MLAKLAQSTTLHLIGGLLTLPIKVFNFHGVGLGATTTLLMDSFELVTGIDAVYLWFMVVNTNSERLVSL